MDFMANFEEFKTEFDTLQKTGDKIYFSTGNNKLKTEISMERIVYDMYDAIKLTTYIEFPGWPDSYYKFAPPDTGKLQDEMHDALYEYGLTFPDIEISSKIIPIGDLDALYFNLRSMGNELLNKLQIYVNSNLYILLKTAKDNTAKDGDNLDDDGVL